MASKLMDLLQEAQEAQKKPLYVTPEGFPVYTMQDANAIAKGILAETKSDMPLAKLGERELQPGGQGYKQSYVSFVAIDPERMLDNRYRKVSEEVGGKIVDKWQVVTDYRAIKEQSTGRIYITSVTAYVVEQNKKTGKPEVTGTMLVPAEEFINGFTSRFADASAINISKAINDFTGSPQTANADDDVFK